MGIVVLIARILFAILFVFSGIGHLTKSEMLAQYATSKKIPLARLSVVVSGLLILLGAVSVALGIWGDLGALFIAVPVLLFAVLMHNFWTIADPGAKAMDQTQFNKDIALVGGALAFFALFSTGVLDDHLTITNALFNLHW